jgi:two-component system, sensor histidine kinase ChiS
MLINSIKSAIKKRMLSNTLESESYFMTLGVFLIVAYIGFYFLNKMISIPNGYENLTLRLIISSFGVMFIFYKYWPSFISKRAPLIFYFVLLLSFPFFFTYMLLHNQESNIWHLNGLVGFVLLSFFVDWISFIILSIIGVSLAVLLKDQAILNSSFTTIFSSYAVPIVYFFIFDQKRKFIQEAKDVHNNEIKTLNEKLEEKVRLRTLDLEKALAAKTDFLNNISHEIRTPIQGLTTISQGVDEHWYVFDEDKKRELIKSISKNSKRLSSLLLNLLDLSKLTAGKMIIDLQLIDFSKNIEEMIDESQSLYLTDKEIRIEFDKETLMVKADAERMNQVLRNLFFNAIKFSPNNSVIKIFSEISGDNFHFSIKDQGIGVPADELEVIFDSFTQSRRTNNGSGGTGLGLSICKEIIEAHNGKIWVENNEDVGATFHFIIPII